MKLKKLFLGAMATALLVPSLVFGATLNVNLKDSAGNAFNDLSNVNVQLKDGFGNLISEVTPEQASISFTDLSHLNSYILVVNYSKTLNDSENGNIGITWKTSKTVRFNSADEVIPKDMFISDPVASNVLLRVRNIQPSWTGVKLYLEPNNTARMSIDKSILVFTMTPNNGQAEATVSLPSMTYNWSIKNQDESETVSGETTRTVRTNSTILADAHAIQTPAINYTFNLRNPDRSSADFNGETINVKVYNMSDQLVTEGSVVANGSSAQLTLNQNLNKEQYKAVITMSNGGNESRVVTRNVNLSFGPVSRTVTLTKLAPVQITFLVRDSRTSANISSGTLKIMDSNNNVLETVNLDGNPVVKNLVYGYAYKIVVNANGYSERTLNLFPRQNATREINLFSM